jgi:LPXTG-motif cell wall-anchored protein
MKKWLPVIVALSTNLLPISAAFAACGGSGNFPGGDNCGLTGGGYQGAPGPIIGGIPALLGLGGLWAYRRFKKKQNS